MFYAVAIAVWISVAIFSNFEWYWIAGLYSIPMLVFGLRVQQVLSVSLHIAISIAAALLIRYYTGTWCGIFLYIGGYLAIIFGLVTLFCKDEDYSQYSVAMLSVALGATCYFLVGNTVDWLHRPIKVVNTLDEACASDSAAGIILANHKFSFSQSVSSEIKSITTGGKTPGGVTSATLISPVVPKEIIEFKAGDSTCLWLLCESSSKPGCYNSFEKWNGHGLFAKRDEVYNIEGLRSLGQKFGLNVPENAKVLIPAVDAYSARFRWLMIALWFGSPIGLLMCGMISKSKIVRAADMSGIENLPQEDSKSAQTKKPKSDHGTHKKNENSKGIRMSKKVNDPARVTRGPKPLPKNQVLPDFRQAMDDLFLAADVSWEGREQPTGVYTATFAQSIELPNEWIDHLKGLEHFRSINLDGNKLIGIDFDWTEYRVSGKS